MPVSFLFLHPFDIPDRRSILLAEYYLHDFYEVDERKNYSRGGIVSEKLNIELYADNTIKLAY